VLDLGCGAGVPGAKLLVQSGFEVTGLDFSRVQIERARHLVPQADFIEADMAEWSCEPATFEAVVSFSALIHVPQRALFPRIRRWLKRGGYFMAIVGHHRWTGVEEYYGSPMFWDDADAATYLDWFAAAGFEVLWHCFVAEGDSGHADPGHGPVTAVPPSMGVKELESRGFEAISGLGLAQASSSKLAACADGRAVFAAVASILRFTPTPDRRPELGPLEYGSLPASSTVATPVTCRACAPARGAGDAAPAPRHGAGPRTELSVEEGDVREIADELVDGWGEREA
jgi:SAM-dependent methyltransferase